MAQDKKTIHWLVGLGNPGAGYQYHRHNIGFRLVDGLQAAGDFSPWRVVGKAKDIAESQGIWQGKKLTLLKPLGYMNNSGRVLQSYMAGKKFLPEQLLVLADEIALPFGKVKIKWGGGEAGHRGLLDISSVFGKNYGRFRFGVGHPGGRDMVSDYVLENFSADEEKTIAELLPIIAEHFHHIVARDEGLFLQALTQK